MLENRARIATKRVSMRDIGSRLMGGLLGPGVACRVECLTNYRIFYFCTNHLTAEYKAPSHLAAQVVVQQVLWLYSTPHPGLDSMRTAQWCRIAYLLEEGFCHIATSRADGRTTLRVIVRGVSSVVSSSGVTWDIRD